MRGRAELSTSSEDINQAVFHHSAQGEGVQKPSSIRFRGGKDGFGVVTVGTIDDELQTDIIRALVVYAMDNGGRLDVKNLTCGISEEFQAVSYSAVVVIGKSFSYKDRRRNEKVRDHHKFNAKIYSDHKFRDEQLRWEIVKGLSRLGFHAVAPYEAAIQLKQGIGRLKREDDGVQRHIWILDNRAIAGALAEGKHYSIPMGVLKKYNERKTFCRKDLM